MMKRLGNLHPTLPAYCRRVAEAVPAKLARLGREVFGVAEADGAKAAVLAVEALSAFGAELGLPTRLTQLRSRAEVTPELLCRVADTTNLIKTGPCISRPTTSLSCCSRSCKAAHAEQSPAR